MQRPSMAGACRHAVGGRLGTEPLTAGADRCHTLAILGAAGAESMAIRKPTIPCSVLSAPCSVLPTFHFP